MWTSSRNKSGNVDSPRIINFEMRRTERESRYINKINHLSALIAIVRLIVMIYAKLYLHVARLNNANSFNIGGYLERGLSRDLSPAIANITHC